MTPILLELILLLMGGCKKKLELIKPLRMAKLNYKTMPLLKNTPKNRSQAALRG